MACQRHPIVKKCFKYLTTELPKTLWSSVLMYGITITLTIWMRYRPRAPARKNHEGLASPGGIVGAGTTAEAASSLSSAAFSLIIVQAKLAKYGSHLRVRVANATVLHFGFMNTVLAGERLCSANTVPTGPC